MVMGLLDRARAAYDAGKKEAQEIAARTERVENIKQRLQEQNVREQRERAEKEERKQPSRVVRAAGRVAYRGEQIATKASYYGGRIASEVERFGAAGEEAKRKDQQSRSKEKGFGRPVVRPPQSTSALWGFTPTRSQATRSITPAKSKPRKKSTRRDPFDFNFEF